MTEPSGSRLIETLRRRTSQAVCRDLIEKLLSRAGVEIGGSNPWDVIIHDDRFFERAVLGHSIGVGEAYMEGWWDCERLDLLFFRLFQFLPGIDTRPLLGSLSRLGPRLLNLQNRRRSHRVNREHYDLSVELYESMLGESMVYSCAFWDQASDLRTAQEQKLELVCRKLGLQPGMRVLDIGCGFGSFAAYAAERYQVDCVGYTLSQSQHAYAIEHFGGRNVEFRHGDYRDIEGRFDRVASIGMFEAVGQKNISDYMRKVRSLLVPDGSALVHTIGKDEPRAASRHWVDKYIFPNGYIPQLGEIAQGTFGELRIDDLHNFGPDYDSTLMAWHQRFVSAWPELSRSYDDQFRRMWEFYLLMFAGGFRARHWQVWQLLLSPRRSLRQASCRRTVHSTPLISVPHA